jgi:hypothetical protein
MNAAIKAIAKQYLTQCAEHTEAIRQTAVGLADKATERTFEASFNAATPEELRTLAERGLRLAMAFDGVLTVGTIAGMLGDISNELGADEYGNTGDDTDAGDIVPEEYSGPTV